MWFLTRHLSMHERESTRIMILRSMGQLITTKTPYGKIKMVKYKLISRFNPFNILLLIFFGGFL